MKELKKIKLNALSKLNITPREMSALQGGNYCAWGAENRAANESASTCSCKCSGDYYGSTGLSHTASFFKATSSF